jgi:hypothetical protein
VSRRRTTEWLPGNVKPAHVGVYQRDYKSARFSVDRTIGVAYCHWDGKRWSLFDATPRGAKLSEGVFSTNQSLPWRGLAEPHRAAAKKPVNPSAAPVGEKGTE